MSEQGLHIEDSASSPESETSKNPFFEVLASGNFQEDQISIHKVPGPQIPSDLKDYIEKDWQERGTKEDRKKVNQLVPVRINVLDGRLIINAYPTSFAAFQATRSDEIRTQFPEHVADIIGTNIVLETSDNKLLTIQRDPNAATKPGAMSVVGGYPNIEEDKVDENGEWDPFKTVRRELYEETGIDSNNIQDLAAIGVVYNKSSKQPTMVFNAKTSLSAAEIDKLKGVDEEESVNVRFVTNTPKAVEGLILKYALSPSPSGLAGFALYGKEKFGPNWFDWINKRLIRRSDAYSKHIVKDNNSENKLREIEERGVESFLKRTGEF